MEATQIKSFNNNFDGFTNKLLLNQKKFIKTFTSILNYPCRNFVLLKLPVWLNKKSIAS